MSETAAKHREDGPDDVGHYDAFVSYAREDQGAVSMLIQGLEARGKRVWVDLANIPPSAEWMSEIRFAVDAADAFLVALTPAWISSQVCRDELDHAVAANKRIVPVVCADVDPQAVPPELSKRNWIQLGEDDADAAISLLIQAMETDLAAVKLHTRLLIRAREWQQGQESSSLLLRGEELSAAETWLTTRSQGGPEPSAGQVRYVVASRKHATKRQRGVVAAVSLALVVSSVLGVLAVIQRDRARHERAVATSRELAAASASQLEVDPELSLLLGIEAARAAPTDEAASALRDAITGSHHTATLRGHLDPILDAEFNDAGTKVLTTSSYERGLVPGSDRDDRTARVWDATTGESLASFDSIDGAVIHAEFGRGSSTVLLSNDGPTRLVDFVSGETVMEFDHLTRGVADLDPTARMIVGPCGPVRLCLVDAVRGDLLQRFKVPRSDGEMMFGFALDAERLVAGSGRSVLVFDRKSGQLVRRIHAGFDIRWMSMSDDGVRLLVAEVNRVEVWDIDAGALENRWEIHARTPAYPRLIEPEIAPDGERVLTMDDQGTVTLWRTRDANEILVLPAKVVDDVEFSPDGTKILTVSEDQTAAVWDARSGDRLGTFAGGNGRLWMGHFSDDGALVVTAGSDLSARVWVVDPGAPEQIMTARPGGDGQAVSFLPGDDTHLVTAGLAGIARLWDTRSASVEATFDSPLLGRDWIWGVAVSPDGSSLAAAGQHRSVPVWDLPSGEVTTFLRFPRGEGPGSPGAPPFLSGSVWATVFSPDGSQIATASQDGIARLWDADTGTLTQRLEGHGAGVNDIVFSPDGGRLLTGSDDSSVRIWDVRSHETVRTLRGHTEGVQGVAWSPDGTMVASTSYDGTARVWDAGTGEELFVLSGSKGTVMSAVFSPDSRWLATSSDGDGALRVWDVRTGRLVDVHRGTLGSMGFSMDFSHDGTRIAVSGYVGPFGSGVGETLLYRCSVCVGLERLVETAGEMTTRQLTSEERERFLHEAAS